MSKKTRIAAPHADELERISKVLRQIGGDHVVWGARDRLDVLLAEVHLEADRRAAARILVATWVLAAATVGLVVATVGLIIHG